ncbi:hypothetical protein NPIL_108741 [Nephila pilipes]|uniref:Uncharacterized protein n=1 Tax=Nephila pilipes TaxID=299642 RepID=A0A8X6PG22_NEPPI|nr:hypothetical protein NPIL_108741 [Nephila pilipes]
MEQDFIPNVLYNNQYHIFEPTRRSNSYQLVETEGYNTNEQIIPQSEIFLPSAFAHQVPLYIILRVSEVPYQVISYNTPRVSAFPRQVISYDTPPNPIYSFQDNHLSDSPLPQRETHNYSDFVLFPPITVSNIWERSQEISVGSTLNDFPSNTECAAPIQMDNCFVGDAMQEGIFPNIFLPEIFSLEENELHITVRPNSSENSEKMVTTQQNSSNSILKCELCYKVFSTIGMIAVESNICRIWLGTHLFKGVA